MSEKEVRELIGKAERSLRTAERLLEDGDYDFAVSRAYYAMFYVARALLLTRRVRHSKHSGVLAAFNSEFIQTGILPSDLFPVLRDGLEDRIESDYGLAGIAQDQARSSIASARRFVAEGKRLLAEILEARS